MKGVVEDSGGVRQMTIPRITESIFENSCFKKFKTTELIQSLDDF
jgi:hypothetical protein